MEIISYWKDWEEVYKSGEGAVLIRGMYHHQRGGSGQKALGLYWENGFPRSRNVIAPCRLPLDMQNAILSGLLHKAISEKEEENFKSITEAIEYFRDN